MALNVVYWTDTETGQFKVIESRTVEELVDAVVESIRGIKMIDWMDYEPCNEEMIYDAGSVSFSIDVRIAVDVIVNGKFYMAFRGEVKDFWRLMNEQLYILDRPVYNQGII